MKSIVVIVSAEGTCRLETRGFAGPECQMASAFLESTLGTQASTQLTPEYYATEQARHELKEPS